MGSAVEVTAPIAVVGPCAGTPGLTCAHTLMSLLEWAGMKVSVAASRDAVSHCGVAWTKGVHAMGSKLRPWSLIKSD